MWNSKGGWGVQNELESHWKHEFKLVHCIIFLKIDSHHESHTEKCFNG